MENINYESVESTIERLDSTVNKFVKISKEIIRNVNDEDALNNAIQELQRLVNDCEEK